MLRRVTYRQAAIALVFTSLWFVLGFLLLWSPVPGALRIHSMLFAVWLLLFFVLLGFDGATMMLASMNGLFPPRAPRRARYAGTPSQAHQAPARRARPQQGS
jgi:hypothetical protein